MKNLVMDPELLLFGVTKLNILCFGRPGSGKSAFINSSASTLIDKYFEVAPTSAAQVSFTQHITGIPINNNQNIIFIDVFGFSDDNFTKHLLDLLVKGQLKDGYKQGDALDQKSLVNAPLISDEIHAVLFIMDASNIDKKMVTSDYVKYIKEFQSRGINYNSL